MSYRVESGCYDSSILDTNDEDPSSFSGSDWPSFISQNNKSSSIASDRQRQQLTTNNTALNCWMEWTPEQQNGQAGEHAQSKRDEGLELMIAITEEEEEKSRNTATSSSSSHGEAEETTEVSIEQVTRQTLSGSDDETTVELDQAALKNIMKRCSQSLIGQDSVTQQQVDPFKEDAAFEMRTSNTNEIRTNVARSISPEESVFAPMVPTELPIQGEKSIMKPVPQPVASEVESHARSILPSNNEHDSNAPTSRSTMTTTTQAREKAVVASTQEQSKIASISSSCGVDLPAASTGSLSKVEHNQHQHGFYTNAFERDCPEKQSIPVAVNPFLTLSRGANTNDAQQNLFESGRGPFQATNPQNPRNCAAHNTDCGTFTNGQGAMNAENCQQVGSGWDTFRQNSQSEPCKGSSLGSALESGQPNITNIIESSNVNTVVKIPEPSMEESDACDETYESSFDLSPRSEDVLFRAMATSTLATNQMEHGSYTESLATFDAAVCLYKLVVDVSIMAVVNMASCYRNMSSLACKLQRFTEAVEYSRQSVVLFHRARATLSDRFKSQTSGALTTLDGKRLDNSEAPDEKSCNDEDTLCLDLIIVQTLQRQANCHVKYLGDMQAAIACHEVAARHLVDISIEKQFVSSYPAIEVEGVSYTLITIEEHKKHLCRTLEALGSYYTETFETNKSMSLAIYEEGLETLQTLGNTDQADDELVHSVSLIFRYLSEVYFLRRDIDRSIEALHDSMAVKLSASGEPDKEALKILDKMGDANEQIGNYDKARSCYDLTLVARSEFFGRTHLSVAKSLANIGRVVEKQQKGPTSESLELFKAANAIYAMHTKSLSSPAISRDVEDIINQVRHASQPELQAEIVKKLDRSVEEKSPEKGREHDKAQLYFELGRSFMAMGNFKMASTCLITVLKATDQDNDCALHGILQSLEFAECQEKPDSVAVEQLNSSIQSLGNILSVSDKKTETARVKTSEEMNKENDDNCPGILGNDDTAGDRNEELDNTICSWANFSYEPRTWKKSALSNVEEEEKTEMDCAALESNPNYSILCESFRVESTPKVKNARIFNEPDHQDPQVGQGGFLLKSCNKLKTKARKFSTKKLALSTRKVADKGKKAVRTIFRKSAQFFARNRAYEKSEEHLLSCRSSAKTVEDNDSPLSSCVSPTSRFWREAHVAESPNYLRVRRDNV